MKNLISKLIAFSFLFPIVFVVFSIFSTPVHAATLTKAPSNLGLVGYWSFNEGAGTVAHDFSGNGNNGTLTGSPTWVNGKLGQALSFNGSSQYVDAGTPSSSLHPSTAITVCAWIYPTATVGATSGYAIAGSWDGTGAVVGGRSYTLALGGSSNSWSGTAFFISNNGESVPVDSGGTTLESAMVNKWNHVCGTYDGSALKTYYNGRNEGSASASTSIFAGSDHFTIGTHSDSESYFPGYIDDVRVYNRALSAAEIATIYNSGAITQNHSQNVTGGTLDNGLVGLWSFDGKDLSGTTAYDRSGSGNNGTLVGGPTPVAGKLGQALSFNGSSQYVSTSNNSSLKPSLPITISAWVNTASSTLNQTIFGNDVDGTHYNGVWLSFGPNFACNFGSGGTPGPTARRTKTGVSSIVANTWYHVVCVIRGATDMSLYINGVDDGGSYTGTGGAMTYSSASGNIGRLWTVPFIYWKGSLDDVRIYNRALSAGEVQQLYGLGAGKYQTTDIAKGGGTLTSGLIGYWPFNGKDMSWASTTAAVAYDRSGQGNNGTTTNMSPASVVAGKLGQALSFNGSSQGVNSSIPSSLNNAAAASLCGWVYRTSTSNTVAFGAGSISVNYRFNLIWFSDGKIYFQTGNNNVNQYYYIGLDGTGWHYVCNVFNGSLTGNARVVGYIDGVAQSLTYHATPPATLGSNANMGNFVIGFDKSNGYSTGSIDDVRIYDRALSAGEILQLYNIGR